MVTVNTRDGGYGRGTYAVAINAGAAWPPSTAGDDVHGRRQR